jgi:hypothetical protein
MTTSIDHSPAPSGASSLIRRLAIRTAGLARPLAGTRWFRLWAVLRHVGRTSGRTYAIPVVALPIPGGFLIPLPFGEGTQWLRNLQAADEAGLRHGGHEYVIDRPEPVGLDEVGPELAAPIRFASRRFGIDHFVRVRTVRRV